MAKKVIKRWSQQEDQILLDTLRVYGHKGNSYCFMVVADQIGRSKGAVMAHWYTVLSKRDDVWIGTYITQNSATKNRKNGAGVTSSPAVWKRVLRIISGLFK
jgi:hypothetical protein